MSSNNNRSIVPETIMLLCSRYEQANEFYLLGKSEDVDVKVGFGELSPSVSI